MKVNGKLYQIFLKYQRLSPAKLLRKYAILRHNFYLQNTHFSTMTHRTKPTLAI